MRRGMTVEALQDFVLTQGMSKAGLRLYFTTLWGCFFCFALVACSRASVRLQKLAYKVSLQGPTGL